MGIDLSLKSFFLNKVPSPMGEKSVTYFSLRYWLKIDRKNRDGNAVFKIDMEKSYDILEFDFLNSILSKFGFSAHFIPLVIGILHTPTFLSHGEWSVKRVFFQIQGYLTRRPSFAKPFIIVPDNAE